MLIFKADFRPTPLKRPRLVRNSIIYDPSKKDKKNWLQCVICHAPIKPFPGPLKINLEFYFPRPKSHYRSGKFSELLKQNAPNVHTSMPDVDNLSKFILDAMNGVFYLDDRQVVELNSHKEYTSKNSKGFTMVMIEEYIGKSEHYSKSKNIKNISISMDDVNVNTNNILSELMRNNR